jgi:hypothetical protein
MTKLRNKRHYLIVLVFYLIINNAIGQGQFVKKTIINDTIQQTQLFAADSTLLRVTVFRYDSIRHKFLSYQEVTFNRNGTIRRVVSQPSRKVNEEGIVRYEEAYMDLDNSGRAIKIFLTNNFKLFRWYSYIEEKRKYKRRRM